MASYTCEEVSICKRFQSAICLHCNLRLCVEHINEHNKIIYNNIINLSDDVKKASEEIHDESINRQNKFNEIIHSFNQWKNEQINKIEQIHNKHLELIEYQRNTLTKAEILLLEKLQQNAFQPIEHVKQEQNASIDIMNHIKQTIEKVRNDNIYLQWKLSVPPPPLPNDIELIPLDIPSVSIPDEKINVKKPKILPNGHSIRRLVMKFSNITSIEQSKKDIQHYYDVSSTHKKT